MNGAKREYQRSSTLPAKRLKFIHFIRQRSPQGRFAWHVDHKDTDLTDRLVTIVVLLHGTNTGMQVYGFDRFGYEGVGSAAMFAGAAVHRSVYQVLPPTARWAQHQQPEVVKLAMFFH